MPAYCDPYTGDHRRTSHFQMAQKTNAAYLDFTPTPVGRETVKVLSGYVA